MIQLDSAINAMSDAINAKTIKKNAQNVQEID